MSTCATCRHWQEDDYETGKHEGHEQARRWGTCALAGSHNGYADEPGSLAHASDSECYAANLVTAAAFGCNQHRTREER